MTGQRLAVGTALALAGPTAAAHGAFGDAGAFYSGLVHPFMVPAHLLTLLAFGLLVGQQAALGARHPLFVEVTFAGHCAGIGVGIAMGLSGVLSVELPAATLMLVAVVAGVVVAGARALPAPVIWCMSGVVGGALGVDSVPAAPTLTGNLVAGAGTLLAAGLSPVYPMTLASHARRSWQLIAVRVAGSWLAACGVLGAAFLLTRA